MKMGRDEIIARMTPAAPDLPQLETVVLMCEQRQARAAERLKRAQDEQADADAALERAITARTKWIENNPDPQLMML